MLAFLGAVICIIASVHPGLGRAAPRTPADNESLSAAAALQPLPPGSVAEAGVLGALHGPDTAGRGGGLGLAAGLGMEAPALPGPSGGGGGATFSFNRLVCTPVLPGECRPAHKQAADEPPVFPGEEHSQLRSAAEQLRQTVLLQKDQILTDLETIRELTGKLSECESGLEERSLPPGLWGGGRDAVRRMAGDDAPGGGVGGVGGAHTARAVEELERAIRQLKERIEKLEAELGSRANASVPSGAPWRQGDPVQLRVDDLEEELQRKLAQLEKERTALLRETGQHRHELDQDINSLHHRIAELEQGLSEYNYPEGYKLSFPVRTNYMYGVVRRDVPEMYSFTACLWLRPSSPGIGTPFSYSVPKQPNEIVLLQGVHNPVELLINDKVAQLPLQLDQGKWHHVCVSWTLRDGVWQAYQDGRLRGQGENLAAWHPIRPGGVLILGQEQDTLGGRFDASQALVGELSQFNLWDRVLTPSEVASLADCSETSVGNVAPWSDRYVDVFGGAAKEPLEPCRERRGPGAQ
ncbi:neuronal pentraxin receptor b [Lepisosteus oculatus]|uniref:neuronal pentraxin receptor b n=1 Tax=Lepisosteus oculatus TaxID=7918 RepID=UPI0035F51E6C